jgi:hypothetical protein
VVVVAVYGILVVDTFGVFGPTSSLKSATNRSTSACVCACVSALVMINYVVCRVVVAMADMCDRTHSCEYCILHNGRQNDRLESSPSTAHRIGKGFLGTTVQGIDQLRTQARPCCTTEAAWVGNIIVSYIGSSQTTCTNRAYLSHRL